MSPRVELRTPVLGDEGEFLEAVRRSRSLHAPWVSPPSTPERFRGYVQGMQGPVNWSFLVCERQGGRIAGVVDLTNIVMGIFRSGYLAYYAFAGFERRGFMGEGLGEVVRYAFRGLKLHRLEANIQPENLASIALVRSCGFFLEGYSPRYLKIRGRWRDHERWAIVAR